MIAWLAVAAVAGERTWYVVPNVGFDTDDGFGLGARGEVAWLEPGLEPYKLSLVAQGYVSTDGYQHHRFRLDRVGLGARHQTRVTLHVAWRQWLNDGYFGIGNATTREAAFVGTFDRDDPARRRYRYSLLQPFAHLTVRHALREGGPTELFAALNPKFSIVNDYAESLLEEEQPYGMAGGPVVQVFLGALHDTRAPEIAPVKGHLFELSGRVAPRLSGEAGGFGGGLASARAYTSFGDRVVLAHRTMAEWLTGEIPFYEMVHWGGAIPVSGVGGADTLRGIFFGRFRAPAKAIANTELRLALVRLPGERPVVFELAPYVDVGTVWGLPDPVATSWPVHPAAGGAVRVIFDETFVGRVDTGVGLDPVVDASGGITQAPTWGFYLAFDHPF